MELKYILIVLALFPSMVCGENIFKGSVEDIDNNPISDAIIMIASEKDSILYGLTYSKTNGEFNLTINDSISFPAFIKVYKKGYEEFCNKLDTTRIDRIILNKIASELIEYVVEAKKSAFKSIPGGVKYDPSDLYGVMKNAKEILENAPMIEAGRNGVNILSKINTAKVYINGQPLMQPFEVAREILSNMPPQSIKNIEIIFNPSSKHSTEVKQGGIINIILRDYVVGILAGLNINATYTNNKISDYNTIWTTYQKEKISLTASITNIDNANKYTIANISSLISEPNVAKSENTVNRLDSHDILGTACIEYRPTNQYIALAATVNGHKSWSQQKAFTQQNSNINIDYNLRATSISESFQAFGKPNAGLSARYLLYLNNNWTIDLMAGYYHQSINPNIYRAEYENNATSTVKQITNSGGQSTRGQFSLEKSFKFPLHISLSVDYISTNFKYEFNSEEENITFKYKESSVNPSFSASINTSFLSFQGGIRLEYMTRKINELEQQNNVTNSFINFIPDISTSLTLNKLHIISIGLTSYTNNYTIAEICPIKRWLSSTQYSIGNPNLKSMLSNDYWLRYNIGSFFQFNLNYRYLRNIASETIIPIDDYTTILTTIPGTRNKNIITEIYFDKWFIKHWFNISARASYKWNKWISQSNDYANITNNSFSFRISPSCYVSKNQNIRIFTSYEYIRGQKTNSQNLPSRHILNFNCSKTFSFGLDCQISYSQQLNKTSKSYYSNYYTYTINTSDITKPSISISLNYNFGNIKVKRSSFGNIVNAERMTF